MTLNELLPQRLADWRFASERQSLTVPATDRAVTITADCADAIGCRLWDVALQPTAAAPEYDLGAKAQRLVDRVTGLLEPLKVVEVDVSRRTAQLRSDEPSRRGDDLLYYEILLEGNGAATVRRFQYHQGSGRRQQVNFTLTHEALAKLVADLAAE